MNCVLLQPSYIPWRGYFHQIQKADVFVFYDDVQYDKHGWRNRNRIKTPQGTPWLTIPVRSQGCVSEGLLINEIVMDRSSNWATKHARSLCQFYGRTPFFQDIWPTLEPFYQSPPERLADFTIPLTIAIAKHLGINSTRFLRSSEVGGQGTKTDRILSILRAVGATHYISGPSAREYLDEASMAEQGISVEYMSYNYPEYPQLHPPFEPQVTVLDLLFMTGSAAGSYIWGSKQSANDAVKSIQ